MRNRQVERRQEQKLKVSKIVEQKKRARFKKYLGGKASNT